MAKKPLKKSPATGANNPADAATVVPVPSALGPEAVLVGGVSVPAADLAHITPELRPLAVPVDSLRQDPRNARTHGDRNQSAINTSLEKFGQQRPISVDADGIILAGNGTHAQARELGWKYIAAVRSHLKGPEARAYAIADNRTAELATWDAQELANQLDEIRDADVGIDLSDLEFTNDELDALLSGLDDDGDPQPNNAGKGSGSGAGAGREQWKIVIDCRDEMHQTEMLDRFGAEGLKVRALMG